MFQRKQFHFLINSTRISTGGVEDFIANSVWTDDYLWGDCKKAGKDAECVPYVRAGGRRCSGA